MNDLPAWVLQYLGTVPQWGMLIIMATVAIRVSPEWMKAWLEAAKAKRQQHGARIVELERQVKECRDECDKVHQDYRKQILGMDAQRIQEQLSLISIIMQTVDNPLLKQMFDQLQSQRAVRQAQYVGGPVADAETHQG